MWHRKLCLGKSEKIALSGRTESIKLVVGNEARKVVWD